MGIILCEFFYFNNKLGIKPARADIIILQIFISNTLSIQISIKLVHIINWFIYLTSV